MSSWPQSHAAAALLFHMQCIVTEKCIVFATLVMFQPQQPLLNRAYNSPFGTVMVDCGAGNALRHRWPASAVLYWNTLPV